MNEYDSVNRQALLSHLYDVRALELTKYKLTAEINDHANCINHLGYKLPLTKPKVIKKSMICFFIAFLIALVPFVIFGIAESYEITDEVRVHMFLDDFDGFFLWRYREFDPLSDPYYVYIVPIQPAFNHYLLISVSLSAGAAVITAVIVCMLNLKKLSTYNRRKKEDEMRVRSELKQKQSLIQRNEKLNQELGELNKILAQNYAIHLIPGQFRNVEGVCYLYEYLSTSRESFQSALINFNMNRLNRNMQQMIQTQCDMLIQQYITNARLADVKNQNSAMLGRLSAIEQNTELAAKYAAMNEMNTRTISFFKAYEFFRQT